MGFLKNEQECNIRFIIIHDYGFKISDIDQLILALIFRFGHCIYMDFTYSRYLHEVIETFERTLWFLEPATHFTLAFGIVHPSRSVDLLRSSEIYLSRLNYIQNISITRQLVETYCRLKINIYFFLSSWQKIETVTKWMTVFPSPLFQCCFARQQNRVDLRPKEWFKGEI